MKPEDLALLSGITACVVQVDKRFGVNLVQRLPAGWRWVPSVLVSALIAGVDALTRGRTWQETLVLAVGGAVGAMGVDAGLRESPIPWSGGAGGVSK